MKKFIVIKLKNLFFPILFVLFTTCLLLFSNSNLQAAKAGLQLWANSVLPSLLPFFIATELLSYTNVISFLGKFFGKFMRPLFGVPGEGSFAFIMGIISGYPTGAKIVTNFREKGICTKVEAERLLAFTNNSGPLFIVGTVGISLFADTTTGFLLLATHIISCITVGILFRFWKRNDKSSFCHKKTSSLSHEFVQFSNLGEVLAKSIMNSISTIVLIGGFVVLFSVIISILKQSGVLQALASCITPLLACLSVPQQFSAPILSGILELTNGIKEIAFIPGKAISTNLILCSFLLRFWRYFCIATSF